MAEFSFKNDFKRIQWGATAQVNLIRSVCAGIGLAIVSLVILQKPILEALAIIPGSPLAYFLIFLPFGLACSWLSSIGVPWVGLFSLVAALFIVLGDPLVYLIHKWQPSFVPVQEYGFFNFQLVIYVLETEN